MNKYYKFFYIFTTFLFFIITIALYINYVQKETLKDKILEIQAKNIINFVNSFRKTYQEKFLENKIPLNDKTIHLIPVATLPFISKHLSQKIDGKVRIKLVSDRPRNIKNKANVEEMKIINYFKETKTDKPYIENDGESFTYYQPLYIKQTCLKCHSTQKLAPKYIKNNYNLSYGYNLGDFRGMEIIKISNSDFIKLLRKNFYTRIFIACGLFLMTLSVVWILIKRLEKQEEIYTENLLKANEELQKQTELANENSRAKSEFLANMSHEIRTPLNAMFGFIKLLEESKLDNESKKYLNIVEKSGETVLNVINDILDFSKIESGKFNVEMIHFTIKDEIEIVYHLFESKASEKNINLFLNEHNLDTNIITDPTRLKQVISNLLGNAIKFTPKGKNIYLSMKFENDELYVEIKDEGIGISTKKLLTIFEPFSQADNSTTRKYGGTGLGLTISHKLIKFLGGELKVESEENKGSRFFFTIPAKKSDKVMKKNVLKTDEKFEYCILLVEDNKANQMFMGVVLKKLGIKYKIANDGVEALQAYKDDNKKYDLILMDENMPNMTGSEATKEIRKFEKENNLKSIFIVALTANALSGDREKFLEIGMNEYLSKPMNIDKLKNILRDLK